MGEIVGEVIGGLAGGSVGEPVGEPAGWIRWWSCVATLTIHHALIDEIIAHARREYPREACGIVTGINGRPRRVYPMTNVSPEPTRRYLIDVKEQKAVFEAMRNAGESLLAIFHSHPRTEAVPSETDIELAFYPEAFYVIVSLVNEPPDVRAFRIERDSRTVLPVTLMIAGD